MIQEWKAIILDPLCMRVINFKYKPFSRGPVNARLRQHGLLMLCLARSGVRPA